MLRIVQIVSNLSLGGAQRLLLDICKYLKSKDDVDVRMITIDSGEFVPLFREAGIDVKDLKRKGLVNPAIFRDLISDLRQQPADIVHTHLQKADFYGRLSAAVTGTKNICTTYHGYSTGHKTASDESPGIFDKLDDLVIRLSGSRLIAVSETVKNFLVNRSEFNKDRVEVIYNGIDTVEMSKMSMSEEEALSMRQRFKAGRDTRVILISGRIEPAKGQLFFLKAIENLFTEFPQMNVVILGRGSDESKIKEFTISKGLKERIFLPGFVSNPKPYYEMSDIVAVPSMWEGFGLAAIEGMIMGKIAIVSETGGLKEVVRNGVTGFTFKSGDEEDLQSKLRKILSEFEELEDIRQRAVSEVKKRFDITSSAEAYYQFYRKLSGRS
ncbi:MAG: glycosyltransferase family 4 protein [Ignavibacteria bacterium]|nr:glycosyltransferase family 4 protein [Ignavibacteria bacterium]